MKILKYLLSLVIFVNIANAAYINVSYKNDFLENRKNIINQQIENLKDLTDKEKVEKVNYFFNTYMYLKSDKELYNIDDFHAPIEISLKKMSGDSEDFALAKIKALEYLNVKNNKLLIIEKNKEKEYKLISKIDNRYYILDEKSKFMKKLLKEDLKEKNEEFKYIKSASEFLKESSKKVQNFI